MAQRAFRQVQKFADKSGCACQQREMLQFYWSIGRDISQMELTAKYGSGFYKKLSSDLKAIFPDSSSFSETNLRYMWRFYELYPLTENLPQLGANFDNENLPQLVANSDDYKNIFLIPWGHHKVIIDKCRGEQQKALFYVNKVIENNWSRAVLLNFLDTGLYDRQGKAITNFQTTLPAVQSDLAQAITKDPYNFDFLTLTEKYNEKELKDALMDNITRFLLELGSGFSFVGREYRLEIGETENFVDMLFFNINLRCYVVLEVKVTEFSRPLRDSSELMLWRSIISSKRTGRILRWDCLSASRWTRSKRSMHLNPPRSRWACRAMNFPS